MTNIREEDSEEQRSSCSRGSQSFQSSSSGSSSQSIGSPPVSEVDKHEIQLIIENPEEEKDCEGKN